MINVTQSGGVFRITLNRPEKANSLTERMLIDLIAAVKKANGAKAVVFTGAGKVFSAGADLEQAKNGLATSPLWEQLSGAVEEIPGLTICALNGTLAGGAFGLALACDLRIAVPQSKFFYPVLKNGFLPQPSDPKRMIQLIGPARTKLILLAGQKITSDQALSFGLVDQIVPSDQLVKAVENMCHDAISAPLETVQAIKSLCQPEEKTAKEGKEK